MNKTQIKIAVIAGAVVLLGLLGWGYVASTPIHNFIGPTPGRIHVDGTEFERDTDFLGGLLSFKQDYRIIGMAWEWNVMPLDRKVFLRHLDACQKNNINLVVSYGGPGIGKPVGAQNKGGAPYKAFPEQNDPYWEECDWRLAEMLRRGMSAGCGFTFADQGVAGWDHNLLEKATKDIAKHYNGKSRLYLALSEYDECGSGPRQLGVRLLHAFRRESKDPVSLHSVSQMGRYGGDCGEVDFICHQNWSESAIVNHLAGWQKPVIVIEDQKAKKDPAKKIARFQRAEELGAAYVFTSNHSGWSNTEEQFLRALR